MTIGPGAMTSGHSDRGGDVPWGRSTEGKGGDAPLRVTPRAEAGLATRTRRALGVLPLVAGALHLHPPRGYTGGAIALSPGVETLAQPAQRRRRTVAA